MEPIYGLYIKMYSRHFEQNTYSLDKYKSHLLDVEDESLFKSSVVQGLTLWLTASSFALIDGDMMSINNSWYLEH